MPDDAPLDWTPLLIDVIWVDTRDEDAEVGMPEEVCWLDGADVDPVAEEDPCCEEFTLEPQDEETIEEVRFELSWLDVSSEEVSEVSNEEFGLEG